MILAIGIFSIVYFANSNYSVCSFIGGKTEILSTECHCVSIPCSATVCSHKNTCVLGK